MAESVPAIIGFMGSQKSASDVVKQAGEEQGREDFRTAEMVRQRRRETETLKGTQSALTSASGVAFSGSPLEIFKETAQRGLEDETFIKAGGSKILKRAKRRASAQRIQSIGTLITATEKVRKTKPRKTKPKT